MSIVFLWKNISTSRVGPSKISSSCEKISCGCDLGRTRTYMLGQDGTENHASPKRGSWPSIIFVCCGLFLIVDVSLRQSVRRVVDRAVVNEIIVVGYLCNANA